MYQQYYYKREKMCENYILSLNLGLPTNKDNVSLESSM